MLESRHATAGDARVLIQREANTTMQEMRNVSYILAVRGSSDGLARITKRLLRKRSMIYGADYNSGTHDLSFQEDV